MRADASTETTLRNGARIRIRPVVPDDRHLLEVAFARMSPTSRYFRFLAPKSRLSDSDLDDLTSAADHDHRALVAVDIDGRPPQPAGFARYVRLPDRRETAELAMVVMDDRQGLGLGHVLIGALARQAVADGVTQFVALVHPDNSKMLSLLRELGAVAAPAVDGPIEVHLPLLAIPLPVLPLPAATRHEPGQPVAGRIAAQPGS